MNPNPCSTTSLFDLASMLMLGMAIFSIICITVGYIWIIKQENKRINKRNHERNQSQ